MFKTLKQGVRVLEENYAVCIRWVCSINPEYIDYLTCGYGIFQLPDLVGENYKKAEAWKDKLNAMKAVLGLTEDEVRKIDKRIRKRTLDKIRAEIEASGKKKK